MYQDGVNRYFNEYQGNPFFRFCQSLKVSEFKSPQYWIQFGQKEKSRKSVYGYTTMTGYQNKSDISRNRPHEGDCEVR